MSDEIILKKLEHRLNRRSFLRGSGLAAASIAALGMPRHAAGQDLPRDQDKDKKDEPTGDKPADPPAGNTDAGKPEEDEFKITRKDERGREYRICPQCGYNMYRQDRTWTCENCGYSYID
jgi:ribosomal protein S27AE